MWPSVTHKAQAGERESATDVLMLRSEYGELVTGCRGIRVVYGPELAPRRTEISRESGLPSANGDFSKSSVTVKTPPATCTLSLLISLLICTPPELNKRKTMSYWPLAGFPLSV